MASVCVEIEAGKSLHDKLRLEIAKDSAIEIGVEIPLLSKSCRKYGLFGHQCKEEQQVPIHDILVSVKMN